MSASRKITAVATIIALGSFLSGVPAHSQGVASGLEGASGLPMGADMFEPFGEPGGIGGAAGSSSAGSGFGSFPATTVPFGGIDNTANSGNSNNGRSYGVNLGPDFQNTPGPNFGGNSQFGVRPGSTLSPPFNPLNNSAISGQVGGARPFGFMLGNNNQRTNNSLGTHSASGSSSPHGHIGPSPAFAHPSLGSGSSAVHYGRPYVGATRTYYPGENGYSQNPVLPKRSR